MSRENSWPGQVEQALGEPVYNAGVGGYSIIQYIETTKFALKNGAKKILIALYPYNDFQICDVVRLSYWMDGLFRSALREINSFCGLSEDKLRQSPRDIMVLPKNKRNFRRWLLANSALASMSRHVADTIIARRDNFSRNRFFSHNSVSKATASCANSKKDFIFEVFGGKDFIPAGRRETAPYLNDKKDLARSIFVRVVDHLQALAREHNAALSFMVIPSQVRIIRQFLTTSTQETAIPAWVHDVVRAETQVTTLMTTELRSRGLLTIDATPALVQAYGHALKDGRPFFPCLDDHPLEEGYKAQAKAFLAVLSQSEMGHAMAVRPQRYSAK